MLETKLSQSEARAKFPTYQRLKTIFQQQITKSNLEFWNIHSPPSQHCVATFPGPIAQDE